MKNAIRIADEKIYVDSMYHDKPKEYFKLIEKAIRKNKRFFPHDAGKTIMDIGCANGALLSYLGKTFSKTLLIGFEPVASLIKIGKKLDTRVNFINKGLFDINARDLKVKGDIVMATGVLGIFNDPSLFVKKLLSLMNETGKIFIFSPFNEEPIDVILKYRYSYNKNWEMGHNLFSMKTMETIALQNKLSYEWVDFKMKIKIPKSDDPMRSWTEPFRGNPNHIIYGTNMFSTMKLLILTKSRTK
jgi:2-polyprenyl-3-methyl-5-hydroxy-6-metoxy-1,4-benzoquinol methylase